LEEKKRVLVVLGGSGGIGLAVVRRAVADGYSVAIGYHNGRKAALAICDEFMSQGPTLRAWPVDVTDVISVENFFSLVEKNLGVPGGMVFAAGISGRLEALIDASPESVARILNTNLLGAFYAVQSAARLMVRSRSGIGGSIVIITSEAGKHGGVRMSAYAASKAGLNAMVLGAARELAIDGVRLNGLSPGVIDTDQHAEISDSRRVGLLSSIPLGRMGRPEEVANAVLWLISEEASYVVGSVLSINGGR
jgi:NAD(P)-dependent dehydrogenase (short-subunit alcohol dehydrogenase family)